MADDEYNALLDKVQERVGRFLWHWALMESQMRNVMGTMLGIGGLEVRILTVNIQLRDKIHILKSLATIRMLAPDAEAFADVLNEVATMSGARNMMAHEVFGPTDDGKAVEFLTVKARGQIKFPEVTWTHEQFKAAYKKIDGFAEAIKAAQTKIIVPTSAGVPKPTNALLLGASAR